MVQALPSRSLARPRSDSHAIGALTVDYACWPDAKPIDLPNNLGLCLLDKLSRLGREIFMSHSRVNVVQVVQHDPARLIGTDRATYELGIEMTNATDFASYGRVFSVIQRQSCFGRNFLPGRFPDK